MGALLGRYKALHLHRRGLSFLHTNCFILSLDLVICPSFAVISVHSFFNSIPISRHLRFLISSILH